MLTLYEFAKNFREQRKNFQNFLALVFYLAFNLALKYIKYYNRFTMIKIK